MITQDKLKLLNQLQSSDRVQINDQEFQFTLGDSKVTLPVQGNMTDDQMIILQQILDIMKEGNKVKKNHPVQIQIHDSAVFYFSVVFGGIWVISLLFQALLNSPNYNNSNSYSQQSYILRSK